MEPFERHFKSLIKNIENDGTINVRLFSGDITALMDCLDFAYTASRYLKESELKRGTQNGVRRMMNIERDSKELYNILFKQLEIGEPTGDFDN